MASSYYIDFTNGTSSDPGTLALPFKRLNDFTNTARSAGDKAYVRANQTHASSTETIEFLTDGTVDLPIELIGCTSTDPTDPWGDASTVRTIIAFNGSTYKVQPDTDNHWKVKNLVFTKSSVDALAGLYMHDCMGWIFDNIKFDNSTCYAVIYLDGCDWIHFKNSTFVCYEAGNQGGVYGTVSVASFDNCTFLPSTVTATRTDQYIYGTGACRYRFTNCHFGAATSELVDKSVFGAINSGVIRARNCYFHGNTVYSTTAVASAGLLEGSLLAIEDADGVAGAHSVYMGMGNLTKSTVARSGGADSSLKMMPTSFCGINVPLKTHLFDELTGIFSLWCTTTNQTITTYIRSESTWGTAYPTTAQLWVDASYLTSSTGGSRATVESSAVLNSSETWTAFPVASFTPEQAGFAYFNVYLAKYNSGSGCYVDIKPITT